MLPPSDVLWTYSSDLGGTPEYYLYVDGILVERTTRPWKQITLTPGEQVQFEVLDDGATLPQAAHPGRLTLAWYADPDAPAERYRLDEYTDGEWVAGQVAIPAVGQTYFRMVTRYLEDNTTHQLRVVPVASNGEEGTPWLVTVKMVRRPDPVAVAHSVAIAATAEFTAAEP
jgi:hypothetical protein